MRLMLDKMEVDLSIVKKERLELEDYGQNTGNILDNFLSEHDYHDFPQSVPTLPGSDDQDINVDWLSSFFDEPMHDNMSGLNPPLSDIASTHCTPSISSITSINAGADNLFLDSFSTFTEDYINGTTRNENNILKPSSTLRKNNPLLSQTKAASVNTESKNDCVKNNVVKINTVKVENNIDNNSNKSAEMEVDKHFIKTEKQNQQKLLLFMNTPENRAKLAGTNFNIINASLLSKISGQQSNQEKNIANLRKCIKINQQVVKQENSQKIKQDIQKNDEIISGTSIGCSFGTANNINGILQTSVLQGLMKAEKENVEVDSGYESPTSSSGSSPCSPPIDLERRDSYNETLHYIDIPPHERQPFYLSEEEKRTLVIEGLPVPNGLPLNKMEERALKKVRRKIKNKISAQESRRKKKEYMEALEKKVDSYASENNCLKKKVGSLEVANRSLIIQVQKLQALVSSKVVKPSGITATKANQTEDIMVCQS